MDPKKEKDLRDLLLEHIEKSDKANERSADWREKTDAAIIEMRKDIAWYNEFKIGAKFLIAVGKVVIYVITIIGGAILFIQKMYELFKHR